MISAPHALERRRQRRAPHQRAGAGSMRICPCGRALELRRQLGAHFVHCTSCPRVRLRPDAPRRRGPRFARELAVAIAHAMPMRWPAGQHDLALAVAEALAIEVFA